MKVLVLCLFILTTCFAAEKLSTEQEQQLKAQKREKQYLIEDDSTEGTQQKRDERQNSPTKNNNKLDPKKNSRIVNIRIQPNIVSAPIKQFLKPFLQKSNDSRMDRTPQRIPTKIPVVLKTGKVVPCPSHALRLKRLKNKNNESILNSNEENCVSPSPAAPPSLSKPIPNFTIEDRPTLRTEGQPDSKVNGETSNLESNVTLKSDGRETSNDGNNVLDKDSNNSLKGNKDQVPSNIDRKTTEGEQKAINFFIDEPEPLPSQFRKQFKSENKKVTTNKQNEISLVKNNCVSSDSKKDKSRKKEHDNFNVLDPDIVRLSNGTHVLTIKKSESPDEHIIEEIVSRYGEDDTSPTDKRRIINKKPPKPKPAAGEPVKHPNNVKYTEDSNVDLTGLKFRDKTNKGEEDVSDQNDCITITNRKYEEYEEKSPISETVAIELTDSPSIMNEGSQNYLQNYQKYKETGLAQIVPIINRQELNEPINFGEQINPYACSQANTESFVSDTPIIPPYYPNEYPPIDTDTAQYYPNQPEMGNIIPVLPTDFSPDNRVENTLHRIWRTWKDTEVKIRNAHTNDTGKKLDIDIRRLLDHRNDGNNANIISKVAKPSSSLPLKHNGASINP